MHSPNIKGQSLYVRLVPWIGALAAIATVVVGVGLDLSGTQLGVPHPPFIGAWGPRANVLLVVAVPCFAGAVALVPSLLKARAGVFAAALFAITLILRVALSVARGGTHRLDSSLFVGVRGEGKNEYLPSLAAFDYGPRFFLDRFAELVPSLPVHSAGHPPGLLLVMHYLGLDTSPKLAAFIIVVGAISAPLTYVLAKRVFEDEAIARVAGVLAVFAPALLHFGATSADAVYLTLGLLAAITLLGRRPWLGALVLAVVSLFAWSLLAVAAWAAVLILARDGLRPAIRFAALTGIILLAFHALFALATGFDPLGTLHATSRVYEVGIASRRPYAYWLFGSPTAFLLILGAPIFWLALKSLANRSPEALAIAAVIAFSCVLGFTKAETERIWLFYVPLVILAAAPLVRRPQLLAGALAAQAVIYELLFDTLW
jgi:methylthioxylose transferase